MDSVYHPIVSMKFNQLSQKTYAKSIVLKKQCVQTRQLKIYLPQVTATDNIGHKETFSNNLVII